MYAVISSGGKQYRVADGEQIKLEKLPAEVGQTVSFDDVLLLSDGEKVNVGAPYVNNASVKAEVVSHGRHKKIHIIKFKRRKHHMKRQGHRQYYTEVKITAIENK